MTGTTIGNYRIAGKLGEGAMGTVYRAIDVMLDREVAVKALRPELSRQAALVERFRGEAVALARLSHPNIAVLHGLERHDGQLYMVMEFVRGETFEQIIERSVRLAWKRAAELCAAVLDALEHAHERGVVHRDIKPSNLMLSRRGVVKVMDFGIARLRDKNRQTRVGVAVGTRIYMSPEQLRGHDVDGRADVYAMGAVLFELITGRVVFDAESEYDLLMAQLNEPPPPPSTILSGIPATVDALVARAMAKRPEDRYASALEFRRALLDLLDARPAAPSMPAARPEPPAATRETGSPVVARAPETRMAEPESVPEAPHEVESADDAVRSPAPPTRVAAQPAPPTRVAANAAPPTRVAGDAAPPPTRGAAEATAPPTRLAGESGPPAPPTRIGDRSANAEPAVARIASGIGRTVRVRWAEASMTARGTAAAAAAVLLTLTAFAVRGPASVATQVAAEDLLADTTASEPIVRTPRLQRAVVSLDDPSPASSEPPGFRLPQTMTPAGARDSSTAPVRQTARQPAPTETKKAEPPVVTIVSPRETSAAIESVSPRETSAAVEIVSPGEISEAVQTFTDAVRRGDHETVERLYAKVESRDTDQLRMVLQLMREGGLEIAGLRARAGASAADGAARVELDAEARWRSPFGANRRRPIRLAAELGRSGATWRLVGVRIVGDGLE